MTRANVASVIFAVAGLVPFAACVNEIDEGADFIEPEDDRSNEIFQGVYDCTEREDDGYRQGSRFDITVVNVDAKPVEVNTANAYIAMQQAARNAGVTIRIVSGFRTNSQQQYLYGCYTNCNCNNCNLAARPGYSNHQSGHALDLNTSDPGVSSWLRDHGAQFGFSRTVPSEPWHWEWWGNDSDYFGPCGEGEGGGGGGGGSSSGGGGERPSDCPMLPAAGGTIDDGDTCLVLGGPSQYLRSVDDSGNDGDLVWTGTTSNASSVNFAEWYIAVPAGRYTVEAYVDASGLTNPSRQATYQVTAGSTTSNIVVDQRTPGWKSLGSFAFTSAANERVRVGDNTGEAGSLNRKLVFDAIRVLPQECAELEVTTSGGALNVRPTPGTERAPIGTLNDGDVVTRRTTVTGQSISGNNQWHQIQSGSLGGYISANFAVCR